MGKKIKIAGVTWHYFISLYLLTALLQKSRNITKGKKKQNKEKSVPHEHDHLYWPEV